jgi:hypothetical protein
MLKKKGLLVRSVPSANRNVSEDKVVFAHSPHDMARLAVGLGSVKSRIVFDDMQPIRLRLVMIPALWNPSRRRLATKGARRLRSRFWESSFRAPSRRRPSLLLSSAAENRICSGRGELL